MYLHKVQYYETDRMGVTHHSNYIRWMEEARIDFMEKIGWGYDKMEETGIISPVVSVDCKYKVNTSFADEVEIEVSIEELGGVKLSLAYTMRKRGQDTVVCTGHSEHCFLDRDGRVLRLKRQFPGFYQALELYKKDKEL